MSVYSTNSIDTEINYLIVMRVSGEQERVGCRWRSYTMLMCQ